MDEPTSTAKPARTSRFFLIAGLCALAFFSSCGGQIRPDSVIPATQANYHSAEFTACGERFVGMGICPLVSGQDLNNLVLSIQGYYQGTVRVATTCRSDQPLPDSFRYVNGAPVPYYLTGKASQSCLVSFVVSPEYPDEQSNTIVIHSFEGHLWVRVLDPDQGFMGFVTKVASGVSPAQVIKIPGVASPSVDVVFESPLCHVLPNVVTLPVEDGTLTIPLKSFMPNVGVQSCVMNGVAFLPAGPMRITWFIDGYDKAFVPLPVPALSLHKTSLTVTGDPNISVIVLDGHYVLDTSATFDFDPTKPHLLEMLTVNGRSMVGTYAKGKWSWMY